MMRPVSFRMSNNYFNLFSFKVKMSKRLGKRETTAANRRGQSLFRLQTSSDSTVAASR
jgi:hypothetical protein